MKKLFTLFAFAAFFLLGSQAFSQSPNSYNNPAAANFLQNNQLPPSLVNRICAVAAVDFNVPKGVLIAAYQQGTCTIVFDPFLNGYVVSYTGNVSIVLISEL